MRLSRLEASWFRSLRSARVDFRSSASVLVGANNAGKSNILRALDLVLNPDVGRQRNAINQYDFHNADVSNQIRLVVTLTDFNDEEIAVFDIGNMEPLDEDGNVIEGSDDIAIIDQRPLGLRVTAVGSYDSDDDEFDLAWYYTKHEDQGTVVGNSLRRRIGFQSIRGGDGTASWATGISANSLIRRLLARQGASVTKEINELTRAVEDVGRSLGSNDALAALLARLASEVDRVLPLGGNQFRYGAGRRGAQEFLRVMELATAFSDSSVELPLSAHGRGTMSTTALMVVLMFATEFQGSLILALEEPETALHPNLQRLLLKELVGKGVQVIATTHSPVIAGVCQPENILLVKKASGQTIARPLVSGPNTDANSVERDLNRLLAGLVFSKAVLIVEGETDAAFLETIDGRLTDNAEWRGLDVRGISLVEAGGCSAIASLAERLLSLDVPLLGVADNDPSQPYDSVCSWGTNCSQYFLWPRHEQAFDLEGVIAFGTPLTGLINSLDALASQMSLQNEFRGSLVSGAARSGVPGLREWVVSKLASTSGFGGLASELINDPGYPGDGQFRALIKDVMSERLKHRRHMRLLASTLDRADVPPQVVDVLQSISVFLDTGERGGLRQLEL